MSLWKIIIESFMKVYNEYYVLSICTYVYIVYGIFATSNFLQ